jgi:hypothetical protein
MDGKRILVIYSSENVKGKKDATGAFIPEARAFAKLHGVPEENMLGIPAPKLAPKRRFEGVCAFLRNPPTAKVEMIAFFCHGYSSGMQFGMNKKNLRQLVGYMKADCVPKVKLVLYACSTASTNRNSRKVNMPGTDNGYADKLRDEMLRQGFHGGWIDAHLTPGHTTRNPFVLRFYTDNTVDANSFEPTWDLPGGEWLVSPKSALWKKWKKHVQKIKGDFKFQFPFLTEAQIYEYLRDNK